MTLYDQILSMPLFQGLSHDDLNDIVAHTKFEFIKAGAGEAIIKENTACRQLTFLLNGTVAVRTHAGGSGYSVSEHMSQPLTFGLERLFGLMQYYSHEVTAITPCSLFTIDKPEVMKLSDEHLIFRMNIMNRLATDIQKSRRWQWQQRPQSTRGRVVGFLLSHVMRPAGQKEFAITMQQLANETGDSRLKISRLLNEWQSEGLLGLSRGKITIPRFELLLQAAANQPIFNATAPTPAPHRVE